MQAFESITILHFHCITVHPNKFFTCPWCTVPFASLRELQKHALQCLALNKNAPREGVIDTILVFGNKCSMCACTFNSTEEAIKHCTEHHLNFTYFCDACEIYCQNDSELDFHYATNHPVHSSVSSQSSTKRSDRNRGGTGPSGTDRSVNKNKNAASVSDKRRAIKFFMELKCVHCEKEFSNKHEIRTHFQTIVFTCDLCNGAFSHQGTLNAHKKRFHSSYSVCTLSIVYTYVGLNDRNCMWIVDVL